MLGFFIEVTMGKSVMKQLDKQENKALESIGEYNDSIDSLIENLQRCKMNALSVPKIINMREAMSRAEQYGIIKVVGKLWEKAYNEVTTYNEMGLKELRKQDE